MKYFSHIFNYFSDDVVYNQGAGPNSTMRKQHPQGGFTDELGYIAPPNRKLPPVPGSNYNTCDRIKRGTVISKKSSDIATAKACVSRHEQMTLHVASYIIFLYLYTGKTVFRHVRLCADFSFPFISISFFLAGNEQSKEGLQANVQFSALNFFGCNLRNAADLHVAYLFELYLKIRPSALRSSHFCRMTKNCSPYEMNPISFMEF